jgi:pentatricopeptide repeat protein
MSVAVATNMIIGFEHCGDLQSIDNIIQLIPHKNRDVQFWNTIISASGYAGRGERAINTLTEMICYGCKPNEHTLLACLTACSHGGLIDVGIKLYNELPEQYQFSRDIMHHNVVVDMLSRAGRLHEAQEHIKKNIAQPDVVTWTTLAAGIPYQFVPPSYIPKDTYHIWKSAIVR